MRHPTQLYEAICYFALFVVLFLIYRNTKLARKEGFIFGAALVGIFLPRFCIEFIKINQVAFEEGMTFNMGQWLSVPFILVGVGVMVWAYLRKQPVEKAVASTTTMPKTTQTKNKRHFNKR